MSRRQLGVLMLMVAAASSSGCRETEKERPLSSEPGVYRGDKQAPLDENKRKELRERGNLMR